MMTREAVKTTPTGVPVDFWCAFVEEADKLRQMGREYYSARCISEWIRHNRVIQGGVPFKINDHWVPDCARAYMRLRRCPEFFEVRERLAA